jgi:hypothetical protein
LLADRDGARQRQHGDDDRPGNARARTRILRALRGAWDPLMASGRDRRTSACGKRPAPLTPFHLFS